MIARMAVEPVRPICALFLWLVFSVSLAAQTVDSKLPFVIDPNRPYVYIKFDHIGPGIQRTETESKNRIWVWLVNNCRVPIKVNENGTPDGSPRDERQIMYEVVPDVEPMHTIIGPRKGESANQQPAKDSGKREKRPSGYMSEVGSSESIPPDGKVLFSIPLNHLNEKWHVELRYEFDLPEGACCKLPEVGGEPKMVVEYGLWDLPPDAHEQFKRK